MKQIYKRIIELISTGTPGAVATVINTSGSSPARLGQKMVVTQKGYELGTVGGGTLEKKVIDNCFQVMESGCVQKITLDLSDKGEELGMCCGGEAEILIEPFNTNFRVHIIGSGHVGGALVRELENLDFNVFITDDRSDLLNNIKGISAEKITSSKYTDYFQGKSFTANDAFVIVTRGHSHDFECAEQALKTDSPFIGVIGSRKKIIKMFEKLRAKNFQNSDFSRVVSPIGLSIGADTPAEIAVSIAGQLIAWKKGFPFEEICDLSTKWHEKLLKGELPEKAGAKKSVCPA